MTFQEAVKEYGKNPVKEVLNEQVKRLTAEMTLDEKIYMLSGHTLLQIQADMIKTGRNYNVRPLNAGGCKRLEIPPVAFTDGPRGVVMGNSTCFPVSMLRASTFDEELEYRAGKAIAAEAIAQGANYFGGVCINLVRNPKWGRTQETYGEDPCLLGTFGAALTRSVQEEGMIACPKHFAVNSIEDLRFYVDVKADDRTLHEVYLPHFKKCIDAGAQSIMTAYNRFDEWYCSENKKLLTDILREQWGFDGFVMSDFVFAVYDTEHSLRAGLDVEMMFSMHYSGSKIKSLLKKGRLTEGHIDRATGNILRVLIRQVPNIKPRSMSVVGCTEHRALAWEIAEKGMVLLENNGLLPLSKDTPLAVAGDYADTENTGDHGSSRVYDKNIITPCQGLCNVFKTVYKAPSTDVFAVVESAKNADAVVLCVGSNRKMEGEFFATTQYAKNIKPKDVGGDRANLRLSEQEIALIKGVKRAGKKVVVVLYSGSAIIVEEWKQYADAIIMNYYSGCEGGAALANLLSGDANFGGKLPFTVAKKEDDYPPIIGIGQKPYVIEYGYYHGYTLLDKEKKEAAYPFGYGKSYTSFEIDPFTVEQTNTDIVVKTTVKNTGTRKGAEVVQVYIGSAGAEEHRPVKLLKGFKRVELEPNETKAVVISIGKNDLRFYSNGQWILDTEYIVYVGNNSADAGGHSMKIAMVPFS
jgi:beta-glucosidase